MRFFFSFLFSLAIAQFAFSAVPSPARAAVVSIDIGPSLQSEAFQSGCWCFTNATFFAGTLNGVHAGDEINFGKVTINATFFASPNGGFFILGKPFIQDDTPLDQFKANLEGYSYDIGLCEIDYCVLNGNSIPLQI